MTKPEQVQLPPYILTLEVNHYFAPHKTFRRKSPRSFMRKLARTCKHDAYSGVCGRVVLRNLSSECQQRYLTPSAHIFTTNVSAVASLRLLHHHPGNKSATKLLVKLKKKVSVRSFVLVWIYMSCYLLLSSASAQHICDQQLIAVVPC